MKKHLEKFVEKVYVRDGHPSVLNFAGFIANKKKKYDSLKLNDEKWDKLVLWSEADKKICVLDYPAIEAEIATLESRMALAEKKY